MNPFKKVKDWVFGGDRSIAGALAENKLLHAFWGIFEKSNEEDGKRRKSLDQIAKKVRPFVNRPTHNIAGYTGQPARHLVDRVVFLLHGRDCTGYRAQNKPRIIKQRLLHFPFLKRVPRTQYAVVITKRIKIVTDWLSGYDLLNDPRFMGQTIAELQRNPMFEMITEVEREMALALRYARDEFAEAAEFAEAVAVLLPPPPVQPVRAIGFAAWNNQTATAAPAPTPQQTQVQNMTLRQMAEMYDADATLAIFGASEPTLKHLSVLMWALDDAEVIEAGRMAEQLDQLNEDEPHGAITTLKRHLLEVAPVAVGVAEDVSHVFGVIAEACGAGGNITAARREEDRALLAHAVTVRDRIVANTNRKNALEALGTGRNAMQNAELADKTQKIANDTAILNHPDTIADLTAVRARLREG